jgi:alkylation response protein AidB-like acyl-CoA dehydrogenase
VEFELTDEQHALQEVIHDLVAKDCPPALLRAVVEGTDDGASFWKTLVDNDWPGLAIAEAEGGSGATTTELVIALEQMGWGGDPSPFLATTSQYVPLVQECADGDLRAALLDAVCKGGSGTVANTPDTVRAERGDDGWTLRGEARFVFDGGRADEVAVVAATGDGEGDVVGVFVVPAADVRAVPDPAFDGSLHLATITLDGVTVPPDRAMVGDGLARGVERAAEVAVTGLSAEMVGASQRAFEIALDHIKQRKQFGVPIGSFQALKHMAVDVYVAIERARALCQFAGLAIAEDDDRRTVAASMAKAAAGDCQRLTAKHCIQFFGGLGYTWENDVQLYVKRAKAGALLLGSSGDHRAKVARLTLAAALATTQAARR